MKNTLSILLLFILLMSCHTKSDSSIQTNKHPLKKERDVGVKPSKEDTVILRKIVPDYFVIPSKLYEIFAQGDTSKWFISADGTSRLYFVPYTDGSITTAIMTDEKLSDNEYRALLLSENIKIDDVKNAITISKIESERHLKIGATLDQVIAIFGKPDTETKHNTKNELLWNFRMNDKPNYDFGALKPFIEDGFEYSIKMVFENNKLKLLIYGYEIP